MDKCKREEKQETIRNLWDDINSCIDNIVEARIEKDVLAEGKALFRMKWIMIRTLQDLMVIHDLLDVLREISKDEDSISSDVKEQATEAAILTACSEFKRFCDIMGNKVSTETIHAAFCASKKWWAKDFERELRNKLQAHQPM